MRLPTARVVRRLALLALLVALLVASPLGLGSAQKSRAADQCDWGSKVWDPLVNLSEATPAQVCGIEALENSAYQLYAASHDLNSGDPRLGDYTAQVKISGIMWSLFLQVIDAQQNDPSALTTDQVNAYAWLHTIVRTFEVTAAQDATDEYTKWQVDPCSYRTPNEHLYTYYDECTTSMANLFSKPSPPSYQELIEIGRYDAAQTLHMDDSLQGSKYQLLEDEQILEAQASWSAMLIGAVGPIINAVNPLLVAQWLRLVAPHGGIGKSNDALKDLVDKMEKDQGELEDLEGEEVLEEGGEAADPALEEGASVALDESVDAGIDMAGTAVEFGSASITAPLMAVGFAAAIAIQEGIKVFNDAKIPGQLADNLATVKSESLDTMITLPGSTGGLSEIMHDFEAELLLPDPSTGTSRHVVETPPSDGAELRIEHVDDAGTTRFTELTQKAKLAVWPLGLDKGEYGVPQEQIAYYNGQIWRHIGARSDDARAGLSGWVPTGELHYFDWSGHPRYAIVQGDRFLTFPSPGSIDVGGADDGGDCSAAGACTVTDTLPVLLSAGGVDPSYSSTVLTNAGFTEVRTYHASDGTVTPPYQKARLTLEPNPGAPALIAVDNQFGQAANTGTNTESFEGGLRAGDTVTLLDPEAHPFGYGTTYKWEVESRCPYDPLTPPETVEGLTVCSGSADYGGFFLPDDQKDVLTGCPLDCTEDTAFHGNPVLFHTGDTMSVTWPAPGIYHIRLITTDAYGVTHQADRDVTVVGTAPTLTLSSSAGTVGASVYGPVTNGDAVTITGCLTNPASAYVEPTVAFDWGDGTTDTQSAYSGGDTALSFQVGPTDGCAGPWQFTATHTYDLDDVGFDVQKQLHITVSDAFDDSATFSPSVEIHFPSAPPAITSDDQATFAVGSGSQSFEVTATPPDTTTLSLVGGTLPAGLGFTPQADGTGVIEGAPSSAEAGTYPLTLRATNDAGSVDQDFTLTIFDPPAITSPATETLARGASTTVDVTATGSPTPTIAITGSAPDGMTASGGEGAATISGTPDTDGTYDVTVTATSDAGSTVQHLVLTVGDAPVFSSGTHASFVVGSSTSFPVVASAATSYSCEGLCALPPGLFFRDVGDGSAAIWGTATASGGTTVTVTATNAFGQATQDVTVDASATGGPALTFSGADYDSISHLAGFTVGSPGALSISTTDTTASISISGDLPDGVTLTDAGDGTATLSGTPAAGSGGWYGLAVTAHPDSGPDGIAFVELEVVGPPAMTSSATAVFTEGSAGSFTIRASGLPLANVWTEDTLPDGLSLSGSDGDATLSGTPTAGTAGRHTVTVKMENLIDFGTPAMATLTIEIDVPPAVTSAATVGLGEDATSSFTVTTTGYPTPALSVVGDLPPGIAFVDNGDGTGTFSGAATDTTLASYPVTVQASSTAGKATQALELDVGPVPTFSSPDRAAFAVGADGSFTLSSATDPTPSFSVDPGDLPAGLKLTDNGDGTATITHTPDAGSGGLYTVPVTATNDYGSTVRNLMLTVAEAPAWTSSGDGCGSTSFTWDTTDDAVTWQLCSSGYPAPVLALGGTLPPGLTFTDNGDGTATIAGTPVSGSGGDYPLTLTLANGAGTATQPLTLTVTQQAYSTRADPDLLDLGVDEEDTTFVAGQPNSYTIATVGYPMVESFTPVTSLPDWMSLTDNGDGTATVSGTPPLSVLDDDDTYSSTTIKLTQPNGYVTYMRFDVSIASLGFTAAAPPNPVVGTPYSYTFATTDPDATFTLADGDTLPDGLMLSSGGVLSGTPTAVGTWKLSVVATDGTTAVASQPLVLTVVGGAHVLEISAFRVYGPAGLGDWYVTVRNTTSVAVQAFGWKVALFPLGSSTPVEVPLPFDVLEPGEAVTVAGPYFSLQPVVPVGAVGPPMLAAPSGFELVAPDGTVSDRAGVAGADPAVVAGDGLAAPTEGPITQRAFVRRSEDGVLVDTGDNAADFTYSSEIRTQTLSFASTPPSPATVGSTYDAVVEVGGSTSPVTLSVASTSTSGACSLSGSTVTFTGPGSCVLEANQAGDIVYAAAAAVYQTIDVAARTESGGTSSSTGSSGSSGSSSSSTATASAGSGGSLSATRPGGSKPVATVSWTSKTFSKPVTVTVTPDPTLGTTIHGAKHSAVVDITITDSDGHKVTHLSSPLEIVIPVVSSDRFVPMVSENGKVLRNIPLIPHHGRTLPARWEDGYYVEAGYFHILTLHLSIYLATNRQNANLSATGRKLAAPGSRKWGDPELIKPGAPKLHVLERARRRGHRVRFRLYTNEQVKATFSIRSHGKTIRLDARHSFFRGHRVGGRDRKTIRKRVLRRLGSLTVTLRTLHRLPAHATVRVTFVGVDGHRVTRTLRIKR